MLEISLYVFLWILLEHITMKSLTKEKLRLFFSNNYSKQLSVRIILKYGYI